MAKVHIHGMTDGASEGLTATFAYPVGDSDKDTERKNRIGFNLEKMQKKPLEELIILRNQNLETIIKI